MADFILREDFVGRIRWSHASCGQAGCKDESCCCALCRQPIGVPDDDPRWDAGHEECGDDDCPLCVDRVPIILFSGEGKVMLQASFHQKCFEKAFWMPAKPGPIPAKEK